MHPTSMRLRLHNLGIPNLNGRSRALREMLLQAPPPGVAAMLGYAPDRAEAIAAEAGATYPVSYTHLTLPTILRV